MSLFFVGLNPRWQSYTWLPDGINVMYSAGGFWDLQKQSWRRKAKYKSRYGLRWLDSGGFNLLNRFGEYPFSEVDYMNLVAFLRPDFYASMDYPCEPEITRGLGLMTNQERIIATVESAARLMEWESHVPGKLVPVIQGYALEEYLYCLDLMRAAGVVRPYMAVGSMCRRIDSTEIDRLIKGIYHHAKRLGVKQLHYFGLKLAKDLINLNPYIYSRDSAVAFIGYDHAERVNRGGRRYPRGQEEKRKAFEFFTGKLDEFGLRYCLCF